MSAERDLQLDAWKLLRSCLERLRYDHDPGGMGASVGVPLDEYADVAVSVIRALRDREATQRVSMDVRTVVPGVSRVLIEEIEKVWDEYETAELISATNVEGG